MQRKISRQAEAGMFDLKDAALNAVYHTGHPTYLQFSLIFAF